MAMKLGVDRTRGDEAIHPIWRRVRLGLPDRLPGGALLNGLSCVVVLVLGLSGCSSSSSGGSDNGPPSADLSDLLVSAGVLVPAFDSQTLSYAVVALPLTASTTVTATTDDPNATLEINGVAAQSGVAFGPIALATGSNPINIVVTASDAVTTKT